MTIHERATRNKGMHILSNFSFPGQSSTTLSVPPPSQVYRPAATAADPLGLVPCTLGIVGGGRRSEVGGSGLVVGVYSIYIVY